MNVPFKENQTSALWLGCTAKCGRLGGFWEEMPLWHCGNLMEPNLGNELGRCLRGPRIVIFNKLETPNA